MILLVDAGNTRIKWIVWENSEIVRRGHLCHHGIEPHLLGQQLWDELQRPSRVLIASVAGAELEQALKAWINHAWELDLEFARPQVSAFGVKNAYPHPAQMGTDRWVGLIGAKVRRLLPCCIIDCGTAITIDALAAAGGHQGGVIFPGQHLMRASLYRDTRRIPEAAEGQATVFGKNTKDCVWGGTFYAVAAAIEGICERMEAAMTGNVQRVLTGGDAERLLPYLQSHYRLENDLLFYGLLATVGEY